MLRLLPPTEISAQRERLTSGPQLRLVPVVPLFQAGHQSIDEEGRKEVELAASCRSLPAGRSHCFLVDFQTSQRNQCMLFRELAGCRDAKHMPV